VHPCTHTCTPVHPLPFTHTHTLQCVKMSLHLNSCSPAPCRPLRRRKWGGILHGSQMRTLTHHAASHSITQHHTASGQHHAVLSLHHAAPGQQASHSITQHCDGIAKHRDSIAQHSTASHSITQHHTAPHSIT
jgi:hypothetical protein